MEYFKPLAFTLLPYAGAYHGGKITSLAVEQWYEHDLVKPWWRPPNWAFPPVWTTLYGCMGYSSYLVYRDGGGFGGEAKGPLMLYATQLALNWAWTPLFFGRKMFGWAYLDSLAMNACIAGCMYLYRPINKTASYLLIPYLAWVAYASFINLYVWRNNPPRAKIVEIRDDPPASSAEVQGEGVQEEADKDK